MFRLQIQSSQIRRFILKVVVLIWWKKLKQNMSKAYFNISYKVGRIQKVPPQKIFTIIPENVNLMNIIFMNMLLCMTTGTWQM